MKTFRSKTGPVPTRPFFKDYEIEQTCMDELGKAGLLPELPGPIRIDRFIEKRFKISHQYEDLPVGILGFTKFGPNGVEKIIVAKSLEDESTIVSSRRLRTTLAHEAGHGLLHAYLFAGKGTPNVLFDKDHDQTPRIFCRDIPCSEETKMKQYEGKWWEFQANRAMSALLMPKNLVEKAVNSSCKNSGLLGTTVLEEAEKGRVVKELSEIFDVNPVVAKFRLEHLFSL